MTKLGVFLMLLLTDAPEVPDASVCDPEWQVEANGCTYSLGWGKGASYGDVVVQPFKVTAKARCGEVVRVCEKNVRCKCAAKPTKAKTQPALR